MNTEVMYQDTRSPLKRPFADILLSSLTPSGGLWVPEKIPKYNLQATNFDSWQGIDFPLLAADIAAPYVSGWMDKTGLLQLFQKAWAGWGEHPPPLIELSPQLYLLELFHGPSLSFKDYGLRFLAECFQVELERQQQKGVVLVATSGDTGAAAAHALAQMDNIELIILLPQGRVSDIQLQQMTCGLGESVHPIQVAGTFDQCQAMVKDCLNQPLPKNSRFLSVNSINFGRILAQMSYYTATATHLYQQLGQQASFCIPSGNFGNAYAGWIAKQSGAPIDRLQVACNQNDSLHQFFAQGLHRADPLPEAQPTLAVAMDISRPSNLERLVFNCAGNSADTYNSWLTDPGNLYLHADSLNALKEDWSSSAHSDADILREIARVHEDHGHLIDPHTAIAALSAQQMLHNKSSPSPVVVVSTAHPCKFPSAIEQAGLQPAQIPQAVARRLASSQPRSINMPAQSDQLADYVQHLLT